LHQSTRFVFLYHPQASRRSLSNFNILRVAFQTIRKFPRTSLRPSSSNPSSFSSSPFFSYLRRGLPVLKATMSLEERGWTKQILRPGNGVKPRKGDTVSLAYTGWIKDLSNTNDHCKGKQFDTSRQRGPFQTIIGVGAVIQGRSMPTHSTSVLNAHLGLCDRTQQLLDANLLSGWDKGVLDMSLHEKSILTIDS
jgi:hypothetical protein